MRHCLELIECQEARCSLNGMDGTEDTCQCVAVGRVLLEYDQVLIETVQVFVAFYQEFFDDIGITHGCTFNTGELHTIPFVIDQLFIGSSSRALRFSVRRSTSAALRPFLSNF